MATTEREEIESEIGPGDGQLAVSRAIIETDSTLPARALPSDARLPGSARNLDRAAILVVNLSRAGFVVVEKAAYDEGIRAIREAGRGCRACGGRRDAHETAPNCRGFV